VSKPIVEQEYSRWGREVDLESKEMGSKARVHWKSIGYSGPKETRRRVRTAANEESSKRRREHVRTVPGCKIGRNRVYEWRQKKGNRLRGVLSRANKLERLTGGVIVSQFVSMKYLGPDKECQVAEKCRRSHSDTQRPYLEHLRELHWGGHKVDGSLTPQPRKSHAENDP